MNRNFELVIGKICLSFLYLKTAASTKSYISSQQTELNMKYFFISTETLVYHVQQMPSDRSRVFGLIIF